MWKPEKSMEPASRTCPQVQWETLFHTHTHKGGEQLGKVSDVWCQPLVYTHTYVCTRMYMSTCMHAHTNMMNSLWRSWYLYVGVSVHHTSSKMALATTTSCTFHLETRTPHLHQQEVSFLSSCFLSLSAPQNFCNIPARSVMRSEDRFFLNFISIWRYPL